MTIKATLYISLAVSFFTATYSASAQDNSSHAPVMKGSVKAYVISLEDLKETGRDLQKVKNAAGDLYEEVTQKEVTLASMPNLVGAAEVTIPTPTGNATYLSPRKRWINEYMQEMIQIIKLMKADSDEVINGKTEMLVPESSRKTLEELFAEWHSTLTDVHSKLLELEKVSSQKFLNNGVIAKASYSIYNDTKQLETIRQKIYKTLQKAGMQKQTTTSLKQKVE